MEYSWIEYSWIYDTLVMTSYLQSGETTIQKVKSSL